MLGRYNYHSARPGLPDHRHRNAIEICFLLRGRQTYLLGERSYRLQGGDVFIAFPNEQHSTGGLPEEKGALYWMILQIPARSKNFLGLDRPQGRALLQGLLAITHRHFQGSWRMKEHLDAITWLHHQKAGPLTACAMTNHITAFLLDVIACARKNPGRHTTSPLQPVLRHIEENLGEPLPVPRLAALAGLSVPRFKTRFKQEIGVPPGEYVLRARIEEAQRRLARGSVSITRTAYDLAFSSSQYFATVFKRFTGSAPSVHRRRS